ncbi:DUF305 domain-containing protein [Amycolatopsis sp. 195334CR]|uniref:DUF305 domain-containing protein n=1 Tax=Amycolatopsis sp. 195334CR TaxID=2814588 RepID=UPI001A8DFD79|nr:DUF305 domain-containing protein [Amycolatopsis sp. 195334CR]MBN6040992.1 DUF305 domain-containing protein [Amycolatopsis sp. 195334CR]
MKKAFVLAVLAVLVTACGGTEQAHNDQDVSFAKEMVQHHQQALEMSRLVPDRSSSAPVLDLAARIEKAQDPEIKEMEGWLGAWGAAPADEHGGGHGDMAGMMTGAEMTQLAQASGTEFDRLWLELMIKHHRGAVDMAKKQLAEGADPGAKALAQRIIDAQQSEIGEMEQLLNQG